MGVIEISIIDQEERENTKWLTGQVTEPDSGKKLSMQSFTFWILSLE